MPGDGANGNHETSSEDELEEVKEELKTLKEDSVYHEFLLDVSLDRKKAAVEDDGKDASDGEFMIDEELSKRGKQSIEEVDGSSSSSSGEEDNFEEALVDVDNETVAKEELETKPLDVKVPPKALKEAAIRYPPFWRMKDELRRTNDDNYKSDEDPDYHPPEDEAMDAKESNDAEVDEEEGSSSDSDDDVKDEAVEDDISNLVDMIDDLNIPVNDVEIEDEEEEEELSEQPSLLRSIVDFDTSAYKSDEDPDFVPSEAVLNGVANGEDGDDSSSTTTGEADDESSDTDVMEE